jgi:hypothetical protein
MRTRATLLIAAFTILVVVTSALVTSHFGTHDWPTPPMPDTATRLITPTEAAGRVSDRGASGNDGSVPPSAAAVGSARGGRAERGGQSRRTRTDPSTRRGTSRRSGQSGHGGSRRHRGGDRSTAGGSTTHATPGHRTDDGSSPAHTAPSIPSTAPSSPAIEAGAAGETQARSQDPAPTPPDESTGSDAGGSTAWGTGSDTGHGRHGGHSGPISTLLDTLP